MKPKVRRNGVDQMMMIDFYEIKGSVHREIMISRSYSNPVTSDILTVV